MAWTAPRTWVSGETVTAALMNTHVRDNFNALQVVTTKGDLIVATASVTLTRLPIGTDGDALIADSVASMGMRWSSTNKAAVAGSAKGVILNPTLTAIANGNALRGISIDGIIAGSATFTGLTLRGLQVNGSGFTKTGSGTIDTAVALYADSPTIGTTNWVMYLASGHAVLAPGQNFINDTSNGNMTTGLTINQGAADDEILALKSSDVAHGMTTITETDSYATLSKLSGGVGGILVRGLVETGSNHAIRLEGYVTDVTGDRSIASGAPIVLDGYAKSGTTGGTLGADKNIVVIRDGAGPTTRFIFDSDGDSHEDVGTAWTNFDEHDDIALLNLLAAKVTHRDDPIRRNFGKWLKENRQQLEDLKLVKFNCDGHHFINRSRTQELLIGAMRQVGAKLEAQAERLLQLERKVLQLSA